MVNMANMGVISLFTVALVLSLVRGFRKSMRVQRYSAARRLWMDWRWRRAVARMPQLDNFGRPVAS